MAMPKYQLAGVSPASMPAVTSIGYQEGARTYGTLTEAMNRVSNFAMKSAEQYAQIEGREYGALNAPTQQQIEDALASGADPADLVPGDKYTIFGSAARDSALVSITNEMEIAASQNITDLQAMFTNEQISLGEFQSNLQTMVSAQTEVMRNISPIAAQRFSASVATSANAAYLAAVKQQAIRDKADKEIRARVGIDSLIRNAETIVRAGPTVGDDGTVVTVDQKLNAVRDRIAQVSMELNDPQLYSSKIKEFDDAMSAAKIGVVMDEAQFNPERALAVIRGRGTFQDTEVQAAFESMDAEEVRALYDAVIVETSQRLALESAQDAKVQRQRVIQSNELQGQIAHAELIGDTMIRDNLMDALRVVDGAAYASKVKAIQTVGSQVDRPETVRMLEAMSLNGTLTFQAVDSAFSAGEIKQTTYSTFMADLEQQRNTGKATALTWLKNNRGIPQGTLLNYSLVQKAADREVAAIANELTEALRKDPSLDPMQFVQDRVQILEQSGADAASTAKRQAAERRLEEFKAMLGPNVTASDVINWLNNPANSYNEQRRQQSLEMMQILLSLEVD